MKFEEFELERNQSLFEHKVDFNLSESGLHPLPLKEILTVRAKYTTRKRISLWTYKWYAILER